MTKKEKILKNIESIKTAKINIDTIELFDLLENYLLVKYKAQYDNERHYEMVVNNNIVINMDIDTIEDDDVYETKDIAYIEIIYNQGILDFNYDLINDEMETENISNNNKLNLINIIELILKWF